MSTDMPFAGTGDRPAHERLLDILRVFDEQPADPAERAAWLGRYNQALDAARVEAGHLAQEAVVQAYRTTPGTSASRPRSYERTAERLTAAGRSVTFQRVRDLVKRFEERTGERA